MPINRAHTTADIDVTENQYLVTVTFYDVADDQTILWGPEIIRMSLDSTTAQLAARVVERGVAVKALLAKRDVSRAAVPIGTAVVVP